MIARHHRLRDTWGKIYRDAGAHCVSAEQAVPELGGSAAVVADLRVQEDFSFPIRYLDVVVAHPIDCIRGVWKPANAGAAVRTAERSKFRHYAPAQGGQSVLMTPLAYETFGRWGVHAALELKRLARARACRADAMASVDPSAVYRGALTRWRRELSVALQLGNAHVLARCIAAAPLDGSHAAADSREDVVALILER